MGEAQIKGLLYPQHPSLSKTYFLQSAVLPWTLVGIVLTHAFYVYRISLCYLAYEPVAIISSKDVLMRRCL